MNIIHPTAIIGNNVSLEENVEIGPYCVIGDNVTICKNTKLFSHVVVGTIGEYPTRHTSKFTKFPKVLIGSNVIIREFVTINSNVDDGETSVGDNCYLMTKSHIGHDSRLENNVVLCSNSVVGGYSKINSYTYVGLNSSIHQRSIVGKHCIIGANSFFKGTSPDGITWVGVPSIPKKINFFNLEKNLKDKVELELIVQHAKKFIDEF